jgi:hypothetical protein
METTDPSPTPEPIDWGAVCIALVAIIAVVALIRFDLVIDLLIGLSGMRNLGLIGGITFTIGIVAMIAASWIKLLSPMPSVGNLCPECGYDLRGTPESECRLCPECGHRLP